MTDGIIATFEGVLGFKLKDYQVEAVEHAVSVAGDPAPKRHLLHYKTGAGKSITALMMLKAWEQDRVLVITPPSTFDSWIEQGARVGIKVETVSHAKFRQKTFKLDRDVAVIGDEFHLFGGHRGQGWTKLDRLARGLRAPLILASATPNYNDAERVYCIQHVLAPETCKGGYIEFLYAHCITAHNPYGKEPLVERLRNYDTAAEYLADLPYVSYVEDDVVYSIQDEHIPVLFPRSYEAYGLRDDKQRIIASAMEDRHYRAVYSLLYSNGKLQGVVWSWLQDVCTNAPGPVLIYARHETVASALARAMRVANVDNYGLITGKTSTKDKLATIDRARKGELDFLIGTDSLATGTDGLDKVFDWMIILDDTDDDALRRQLVGRILPRGADTDASKKSIYRLVRL